MHQLQVAPEMDVRGFAATFDHFYPSDSETVLRVECVWTEGEPGGYLCVGGGGGCTGKPPVQVQSRAIRDALSAARWAREEFRQGWCW